ncbi:D-2-hydroxyacid dehydrogenase [Bacillus sp. FJAT-42376]|uniref:D-2-hydroxyacid dehydrogenase n=1 Tax=Bacillus sp. FJAT-42376 TaxID=2014076 RepID=UPI000F4D485D|nr:D-2-hydroxyacid dehydrogenase [Bacillus sp. FJAT-42376]AZB41822.1 D-2-hydroxyacid dehydrogenase [Bacillus sp. FJAT-42376]
MGKRKMIIGQNLADSYVQQIQEAIPDWELLVGRDESVWENDMKDAEIIAGWRKGMAGHLSSGSNVKWIQSWSAGVNDIPLDWLEERSIMLTSANGVHASPISETIFALMLGLTRNIHAYLRNQQSKTWHHAGLKLEIHNKTIGILGIGAIGKETAKIAKAFNMNVLGMRHSGKNAEFVDKMYTPDQLNDMLPECDYVVVTLPLTKDTNRMIGKEQFSLMKNSAFLINIGRGDIIVEKDMVAALQSGEIAGAGLDVFENEPLEEASPLWEMENVILTPHTAGSTEYYDERVIGDILLPNLKKYLAGEEPDVNRVDFNKGY